ncbi:iron uptake porin [Tolypothrix sp. NIES-4075]|uniref:iron uptake porin n=1 Tax=Tolypothrix sp. NIES-4075 TaxID=2005459 RepID=UPI000B5CD437|nr:iron uptake porin [Tolypothrix sp. NIES-4075]
MKKKIGNFLFTFPMFLMLFFLAASAKTLAEDGTQTEAKTSSPTLSPLDETAFEAGGTANSTFPDVKLAPLRQIIAQNTPETPTAEPVTSVSELSDIQPTDWAFQALQSLVERYGCIAGYPDSKYRGNRALTRYEFAAGLNACLDQVTKLIASSTANLATKEDLTTLQRLSEEFRPELAQLRGRLDNLEARTAQVEANQFSTTTKLVGEVETVIGGVLAGNNVVTKTAAPRIITFQDRVRLILNTSFTGTDQLRTTLQAGNIASLGGTRSGIFGTTDGRTSDNASPAFSRNEVYISGLRYQFKPTKSTQVNIFPQSDGAFEIGLSGPINPYFEGSAANAISRYARRNMVYDYGDTGPGIAILQQFGKQWQLGLAYTAINGNNPAPDNGLFSGRYVALGQLSYYSPKNNFRLALTYANTYSPPNTTGLTGTNFGPVIGSNLANSTVAGTGTVGNLYGVQAFYKVSPKFAVNGWVGYSAHRYLGRGDAEVWDWGLGLAFPDLFKKASLGGVFIGMEPKLTALSRNVDLGAGAGQVDKDTSLHVEAFYQYQLSDNIAITPGFIWITAPDSNADNPGSVVGWLRTTFRF